VGGGWDPEGGRREEREKEAATAKSRGGRGDGGRRQEEGDLGQTVGEGAEWAEGFGLTSKTLLF
jgi:hypothetical protein